MRHLPSGYHRDRDTLQQTAAYLALWKEQGVRDGRHQTLNAAVVHGVLKGLIIASQPLGRGNRVQMEVVLQILLIDEFEVLLSLDRIFRCFPNQVD